MTTSADDADGSRRPEDRSDQPLDVEAMAGAWAVALGDPRIALRSVAELAALTSRWAADLMPLCGQAGQDLAPARRVGAELVANRLTDPGVLEITQAVLAEHWPAEDGPGMVLAAIASGYSLNMREYALAEQEETIRAIMAALAGVDRSARYSEARFRAVFTGTAIGIGIADRRGRIVQVNQALADLLGYSQQELHLRRAAELVSDDVGRERAEAAFDQLIEGEADRMRGKSALRRSDGEVVWVEVTASLIREERDARFVVAIIDDVTERHVFQEQLRHESTHDPLTGLPNRALFAERVADIVSRAEEDERIGLCYLDLDGFKRVNDAHGHGIGDQLLVAIASRLDSCASRHGYLAARMGGDEFVILAGRSRGTAHLARLADEVVEAVEAPVFLGDRRLRVSASAGVVEYPAREADLHELLKAADLTLYQAKAAGRGRWLMHDPRALVRQVTGHELCCDLLDALDRDEFFLVYQPIVSLPEGTPLGMEALVRWNHPTLGVLSPDTFIGLAEETGVIVRLGRYVLRLACQEAATWAERFPDADLYVSVNLAVAQVTEPSIVDLVARTLAETGLPASRLQLELTESALMDHTGSPVRALRDLAAAGVRVAIDDFGTGYSNLAYLRDLPVHALKLPQQLVGGLGYVEDSGCEVDRRIVDALIRLAHAIGLSVIAEGVELATQAGELCQLRCDSAQGWRFARPCPPAEIEATLSELMAQSGSG